MKFQPRPFQQVGIDHAANFLLNGDLQARQLYAAPTGVGKSVIELKVQEALNAAGNNCWIVTPRDEIIDGMLDKLNRHSADSLDLRIGTPVKLRNRLMSGSVQPPSHYIFDETHHSSAETWQQLYLLSGFAPSVGYTASPYRGSPKSTRAFRDFWGEPAWIITYEEAIAEGFISMPTFSVLPLVDDDIVEVKGGEFDVTSIESATVDRLGDLAEHSRRWYMDRWDRPTIYSFSSSTVCHRFHRELADRGLPSAIVSAATPKVERLPIFKAVEAGLLALIHINIVAEGVDLKLRRYVDGDPTMSPVEWIQKLGRITRPVNPGESPPEYICTNRNILRHAYILEGVVPISAVVETEKKFGPTTRAHTRVLGMEAIGRFKPTATKLLSGANVYVYHMSAVVDRQVFEFCCLVHPTMDPIWATKVNTVNEDGTKAWGNWRQCDPPNDLMGFGSKGSKEPTEKQFNWWRRQAARFGLDPDQEVNRRSFAALPVLNDLGVRLG